MQSNKALAVWPANVRRHPKHCLLITSEAGDRRRDQDAVSRSYVSPGGVTSQATGDQLTYGPKQCNAPGADAVIAAARVAFD